MFESYVEWYKDVGLCICNEASCVDNLEDSGRVQFDSINKEGVNIQETISKCKIRLLKTMDE